MPFKTNLPAGSPSLLSGFSVLAVAGPDSAAFLQAQTMNDVRALRVGHWHWNGWLNPKGRLIALFALLRTAETQFLVILPDLAANALLPLWQRFVFRSKVALSVADHWRVAGQLGGKMRDASARDLAEGSPEQGWCLDVSGDGGVRFLHLQPVEHAVELKVDEEMDAAWRLFDLRHGLPRLTGSGGERWTPHMLSLDRLAAFSVKKGCYPGQEIVARTHFLGQSKRGLFALSGEFSGESAPVTEATGRTIGDIVSLSVDHRFCLAVLPLDAAEQALSVDGRPVTRQPMLSGLQRPA